MSPMMCHSKATAVTSVLISFSLLDTNKLDKVVKSFISSSSPFLQICCKLNKREKVNSLNRQHKQTNKQVIQTYKKLKELIRAKSKVNWEKNAGKIQKNDSRLHYLQYKILFIAFYCGWYFRMWKNVPDGQSVRYVHWKLERIRDWKVTVL